MSNVQTAQGVNPPLLTELRLLLIEPDDAAAAALVALLQGATAKQIQTTVAKTLIQALACLHDQSVDAIIAELNLPDSTSEASLKQLVASAPHTPVVVLVNSDDDAFALELLKLGAQDSLVRGRADGALVLKTLRYAIERKESDQHLTYLSHYDRLTGLANRELFRDRLHQAMTRAERSGQVIALLFLDLDRFKAVNDTLGHLAGDELLIEVAGRLKKSVRRSDTIARLGGDEFTVILEGLEDPLDAEVVCAKILKSLSEPVLIRNQEIYVTTSIGVTFFPADDVDINGLLRNADAAMYRAKEEGRNRYNLFTADINARAVNRMAIESALRHALERQEFHLCYQPKVCVQTGLVLGAEALIRWDNPQRGLVSPVEFIPVAEDTGLIVPIGEWVLRRACADMRKWHAAGFEHVSVAVNLSARQFRHGELVSAVAKILADTGISPRQLELEITESLLMDDTEASQLALRALKALGTSIYLDDFGTGYSSLAYLKKFPLDGLKIDRSFINDLPGDTDGEAITSAILALSKALRLGVVAEGVETREQLNFLRDAGCQVVQGYLFSRPLVFSDFLVWLQRTGPR
jgi:diguanylate cyclase (GGDEF)-like protein